MMRRKSFLTMLVSGVLFLSVATSCNKDDDDKPVSNKYTVSGNASGAQEVPTVASSGTATIVSTYDADANTLGYTITWSNLNDVVNNMHFHGPADPTVSAGVAIAITGWTATKSGTISGTANLTEAQEADLLGGRWYYNIHTPFKTSGEIRGNLTATRQ
jgi:hypothetical protein